MAVHAKPLLHNSFLRKVVYDQCRTHADYVLELMGPHLNESDRILDLGAGNCVVSEMLQERGYEVTPVDIENLSLVPYVRPIVYDGKTLPFEDNSFDVSLLISVLHHTRRPEQVIAEAARVSKRLIILEDVFNSSLEKQITCFIDSVNNQEFRGHPHSNKTDKQWKALFRQFGFQLHHTQYRRWLFFVKHALYYVEKAS